MNNTEIISDKDIQTFSRYEFKYILNKSLSDKIERESRYFMQYDSHIKKDLGNRYFVRSLYFDNSLSSNFYEKVDGMKIRNKYRLRTYSEVLDKNIPIFFIWSFFIIFRKPKFNKHIHWVGVK